jgi:eukaryotic-like serine/threonine-protein kinase
MATVYRARDIKHDRTVAVKVLHPELAEALGAERFLREVQITARLNHPHILPLLDSGAADGLLYYVMPFVEGESLRERLEREGQLGISESLRITREVADALGHAHSLGIVHRDVKPENILLSGSHAVVADFGIARAFDARVAQRLTETGIAIGTPLYMSPEQSSGEATVDGRSDLYALGCVAFEMLTGEPPYGGATAMAITTRKLTESVPPLRTRRPSVGAGAADAIERALARTPADRFRTAQEFADALGEVVTTGERDVAATAAKRTFPWWAVAAVVALVAIGAWAVTSTRGGSARGAGALNSTVAVLPFEFLSADSSQAYIADGLTDEIITSLSMVEGIRVASRTSSTLLARQGLDLATLAERLNVQTVLEGSIRATRDRVRVSARLIQVADGSPTIWSQSYERDADDVLRIQEEIAGAIASALTGQLGAAQASAVASGTTNPEAYDLYLQGRSLRLRQTEQGLNSAVEFFRASIAKAPDFARAHAGLGEALAVLGFYEYQVPREVFPAAARAAETALRLDPRNASALATAAYVKLYYDWDLPGSERAFRLALDADPNAALAHQWYANYLTAARQFDDAEREFRRALQLDPAAPVRHAAAIWAQLYRGDAERAVETYHRVVAIDSSYALSFQWGSQALQVTGRYAEGVAAAEWAHTLSNGGTSFAATLAQAHAANGNAAAARRLLREVERASVVPTYDVAKVYLALGDRTAALRWLERAFEARSHSLVLLRIDPHFAPLRNDPAFQHLLERIGVS